MIHAHRSYSLRVITLDDTWKLYTLKFYDKYLRSEFPPYFNCFNRRVYGDRHAYNIGNWVQLHVEKARTEYVDKGIYMPTLINNAPTDTFAMITTHCRRSFTKNVSIIW